MRKRHFIHPEILLVPLRARVRKRVTSSISLLGEGVEWNEDFSRRFEVAIYMEGHYLCPVYTRQLSNVM